MADTGELHVVECFEELESEYFAHDGWEGLFLFTLLFYHEVETAGDVFHDDGQVTLLGYWGDTSEITLRKYSRMLTMLQ